MNTRFLALIMCLTLHSAHAQTLDITKQFELGNRSFQKHDYDNACTHYRSILRTNNNLINVHYNLAMTLRSMGRMEEAIHHYRKTLTARPMDASAHYGLAEALLSTGNFQEGWREFEWRYQRDGDSRRFGDHLWHNQDLTGKTILVRSEYGQGDTIQFVRYLPMLKDLGARVVLEAQPSLVRLLLPSAYIDEIVTVQENFDNLPDFDYQVPIMSLPNRFNTTIDSVPAEVPYLAADQELIDLWRDHLSHDTNFKIGICWDTSPYYEQFKSPLSQKSILLENFIPLAHLHGVSLYSLQKMNGLDQLEMLPNEVTIHTFGDEFDARNGRFMDTAAVIENLDLIITVDTSIAHLAGALGKPVWVVLPCVADWRWMQNRNTTPWYPTMRLFRQEYPGEWQPVMDNIVNALFGFVLDQRTRSMFIQDTSEKVTAEIAYGELIDKITILEIKDQRINDPEKLRNVRTELNTLRTTYAQRVAHSEKLDSLKRKLFDVNAQLWEIEDNIRNKERSRTFDQEFIELARSVYYTNDERCSIKRQINNVLGSRIVEEKSYQKY